MAKSRFDGLAKEIQTHAEREDLLREKLKSLVGTRVRVAHPEFHSPAQYEPLKDHHPGNYQRVIDMAPWPWTGTVTTFGLPIGSRLGGGVYVTPDDPSSLGQFWTDRIRIKGQQYVEVEANWLSEV